jgi:cyclase
VTLQQITSRVHVEVGHLGSNNSIIVDPAGLIQVDSPHRPTDAIRWAETAATFGETRFVVNTDHHPDHTIGNFWQRGEIVAHRGTRERLLTEPPTDQYLKDLFARIDPEAVDWVDDYTVKVPNVVFSESLDLHVGDNTLELTYRPGHTANSLLAWFPGDAVIFTGDIVCEAGLPSFQDSRLVNWFDAIDAVAEYDFEYLVPGHGEVADRAVVDHYRQLGREVVAEVAGAIAAGHSRDQACDEIRFEDNIHVDTDDYVGYPDSLVEMFQRRSIARIYDDLIEDPQLGNR